MMHQHFAEQVQIDDEAAIPHRIEIGLVVRMLALPTVLNLGFGVVNFWLWWTM